MTCIRFERDGLQPLWNARSDVFQRDNADLHIGYQASVDQEKQWNAYGTGGVRWGGEKRGQTRRSLTKMTENVPSVPGFSSEVTAQ